MRAFNVTVSTLYKQYSEVCEEGGVQFMDFGIDAAFNDCIDGYMVVDITKLKPAKRQRISPVKKICLGHIFRE